MEGEGEGGSQHEVLIYGFYKILSEKQRHLGSLCNGKFNHYTFQLSSSSINQLKLSFDVFLKLFTPVVGL